MYLGYVAMRHPEFKVRMILADQSVLSFAPLSFLFLYSPTVNVELPFFNQQ